MPIIFEQNSSIHLICIKIHKKICCCKNAAIFKVQRIQSASFIPCGAASFTNGQIRIFPMAFIKTAFKQMNITAMQIINGNAVIHIQHPVCMLFLPSSKMQFPLQFGLICSFSGNQNIAVQFAELPCANLFKT